MRINALIQMEFSRLLRRIRLFAATHRDMRMLLQADERALKDIGLTAGDARAVASCERMARAAATRRSEAMAAADQRKLGVREKGRTVSGAASHYSMVVPMTYIQWSCQ